MTTKAMPAYRGPIVRTDANGTSRVVYLHGNEHFHYMTDSEGHWLDEKSLLPMDADQKAQRMNAVHAARKAPQAIEEVGGKPNVAPRGLVILVNYADLAFETPHDTIDSMLNATHFTRKYSFRHLSTDGKSHVYNVKSEGSARKYFLDQSYGVYEPIFDVVGPVTINREMAYYGENDNKGNDKHNGELIKEACLKADEAGVDFTLYDNDNDGYVDFVFVIYAGFGEADGGGENTIWPHQHHLSYTGQTCRVDNKLIGRYACSCELNHTSYVYTGIGTFVHEFSHVLGLPDLYETNDESKDIHTLGTWDIMDYGPYCNDGNTPPSYSAYERFYMGWLQPRVLVEPEYITLQPLNKGKGEALLICKSNSHNLVGWDPNPTTFYLVESRVKNGWDLAIPGGGMLITKIQYNASHWKQNKVNNDPNNQGVDIIEAAPDSLGKFIAQDAYPAGATEWTELAHHEITEIVRNEDYTINFWYRWAERKEGLGNVQRDNVQCTKVIRDGRLYLIYGDRMYDVHGRMIIDD